MRKKVLAEKSVKQGLNQFQFVEQMKTAAELSMLSEEKRAFLAERAQWQGDLNGLGQKVP